jgi:hypothetical protein
MRDIYYPLKNLDASAGYTPATGALTGTITSQVWEPYRDSGGSSSVILSYIVANQGSIHIEIQGRISPNDAWQVLVDLEPLTLDPIVLSGVISNIVAMPQMRVSITGTGAILTQLVLAE